MNLSAPRFGWLRVLLILPAFVFFIIFFELIGKTLAEIQPLESSIPKATFQQTTIHFFDLLGTFLLLWIFMQFVDRKPFITLGFQTKKRSIDFWAGIFLGLIIMASGYGIILLSGELVFSKIIVNYQQLLFAILLFTFVAFVEEVLFRGYILRNFMQSMNKYLALALSSALFAATHGFNPNMNWFSSLSLFLAGILLGISYVYTKNLWFPIALHFSCNFFQSLFGFNVSGQDIYSLIEFTIPDPNLFNGGAFGFEGSYLSLIADILVITGIIWMHQRATPNSKQKNPLIT